MACRNLERGEQAQQSILAELPSAQLDLRQCDLADIPALKHFAEGVQKDYPRLDILLNNAGMNLLRRFENSAGYEMTFATNYLGPFALTRFLFPLLKSSAPSRIVTLSSSAHLNAHINFDDLMLVKDYSLMLAYGQSKLANLLFARELHRRIETAGLDMLSLAAHPGFIRTNMLYRGGARLRILRSIMGFFASAVTDPPEVGVRPQLYAATAAEVEGGAYYVPNKSGRPQVGYSTPESQDAEIAARLWQRTEELLNLEFEI